MATLTNGSGRVTTPELEQFVISNVELTRPNIRLGAGSYGSVEEATIPGAKVAAKKLHLLLTDVGLASLQSDIKIFTFVLYL